MSNPSSGPRVSGRNSRRGLRASRVLQFFEERNAPIVLEPLNRASALRSLAIKFEQLDIHLQSARGRHQERAPRVGNARIGFLALAQKLNQPLQIQGVGARTFLFFGLLFLHDGDPSVRLNHRLCKKIALADIGVITNTQCVSFGLPDLREPLPPDLRVQGIGFAEFLLSFQFRRYASAYRDRLDVLVTASSYSLLRENRSRYDLGKRA